MQYLSKRLNRIEVNQIFLIVNMRESLNGAFNQTSKLVNILMPKKHSDYIVKIALSGQKEPPTMCQNENNASYVSSNLAQDAHNY